MKAVLLRYKKVIYPDLCVAEIVIWKLPKATAERPHGYKYRLNYCNADGVTIFRYDNETRKGDHKHVYGREVTYKFKSLEELLRDFDQDVERARRHT